MFFLEKLLKNKVVFSIVLVLLIIFTASSIYLIYSVSLLTGIENFLRIVVNVVIVLFIGLLTWYGITTILKNSKLHYIIFGSITVVLSAVFLFGGYNINYIYEKINKISSTVSNYSTSLVVLNKNNYNAISDVKGKIGIFEDESNITGYQIPIEVIAEEKLNNEIKYFSNYISLIEALLEGEIDGAFLPTNYVVLFGNLEIDSIENLSRDTKIIYSKEKIITSDRPSSKKGITEPFTLLLMGVDSEKEDIRSSSFNGDALILITFNPKTFNTTMMSIPRDSYVPISCFAGKRKNKITHAAWYGEKCMMETIEGFTGIDIDYFAKINFKGLVKVVDALGGIKVDVPYSFCEQDSNRRFGKHTIYLEKGIRNLNGEEALALSRNRKTHSELCDSKWTKGARNDIIRGQNQQLVLKGIAEKIKGIRDIDTLYKLLDTISMNMETNMATNDILGFYNVFKDMLSKNKDSEAFNIQKLVLKVYFKDIFDYSMITNQGTKQTLSNVVPYEGSIKDVVKAMRINLGLEKFEMIKEFSFDINEPFKEVVIGNGYYNEAGVQLLPSFVGKDKNEAIKYGNRHGIKVNIEYVTSDSSADFVGKIIKQNTYAGMDIEYVTSINIVVVEEVKVKEPVDEKVNCSLVENKDHKNCLIPNFVGEDISVFNSWKAKNNYSILYTTIEIDLTDPIYDASKSGLIFSQSIDKGTSLFDIIGSGTEFAIKYMEKLPDQETDEEESRDEDEQTS